MDHLHRQATSRALLPPPGVMRQAVSIEGNGSGERSEWFLAGTEQSVVRSAKEHRPPKILYPAPDTVIALDPDIPPELQKVFFASTPSSVLILDGAPLADFRWTPVPGTHRLHLIGSDGTVADRLSFEVR